MLILTEPQWRERVAQRALRPEPTTQVVERPAQLGQPFKLAGLIFAPEPRAEIQIPDIKTVAFEIAASPTPSPVLGTIVFTSALIKTEGVEATLSSPATAPSPAGFPTTAPLLPGRPPSRWSGSAWGFARRGDGVQLAAGGTLGGSQMGARIGYRLNPEGQRPLSLSARFYSPLGDTDGAEAAVGVEWKPAAAVPVTLLAERRQAIGRDGRSAFSLMAYGGVSDQKLAGPLVLDAYAQAGLVGLKSRDLFVDGSAAIGVPLGEDDRLRLAGALWGAAQPGVSRVDAGPQVSYRLPVQGKTVRVTADWRFRVAGDAAPGSGPALTLSTAF